MVDKYHANAAADALLDEPRRSQNATANKLAQRADRRFPPIKWMVVGALCGLVAGSAAEYFLTGTVTFWGVVGVSIGLTIGLALDHQGKA